jgi:anti-sigma factor RsiW
MSERDPANQRERWLWEHLDPAGPASDEPCPSNLELAAFVDGRDAEQDRRRLETHLASCRDCLEAVIDATAGRSLEVPPAPQALVAAARTLVPTGAPASGPTAPDATSGPGLWFPWFLVSRWGLIAAASVAVCVLGYLAGEAASSPVGGSSPDVVSEMTFGVIDGSEPDELDLQMLQLALGEVSP